MNNKNIAKIALPLFFIWPFGAFVCSLFDIKSKMSAIVFVLFSALFGYAFTFTDTSADSYRVAYVFTIFDFSSLSDIINVYRAGGSVDVYRFLVYGITKMFTNNAKVVFALFGLVFGFFMYLSLLMLNREKGRRSDIYVIILSVLFFSFNPITNINGARFWTATWVFFYSIVSYVIYDKKHFIAGVLITPLIHFSFLFVIPAVVVFKIFQRFLYSKNGVSKGLYIVFVLSFFISWILETNVINLGFLTEQDVLSASISNKVNIYNSDTITEVINERSKSLFHTVNRFFGYATKIYMFIFLIQIREILKLRRDKLTNKLFAFVLFLMAFGYLAAVIPSGGRFLNVANLIAIVLITRLYVRYPTVKLKRMILFSVPFFSFTILFGIGYLSYSLVSSTIWYGNLFWIIYEGIGYVFSINSF